MVATEVKRSRVRLRDNEPRGATKLAFIPSSRFATWDLAMRLMRYLKRDRNSECRMISFAFAML